MQRQSLPLSHSSKGMLLNLAAPRRIWCRIQNSTDSINEPFFVDFEELDTVDDLKSRIFDKLNGRRWRNVNDNASIALGFINSGDIENDNAGQSSTQLESPVFINAKTASKMGEELWTTPSTQTDVSTSSSELSDSSKDQTLHMGHVEVQRCPQLQGYQSQDTDLPLPPTQIPHGLQGILCTPHSQEFPLHLPKANLYSHIPRIYFHLLYKKPLQYTCEAIDDASFKIIFLPDQSISEIYSELFGSLGQQTASESLLVFSSERLSLHDVYTDISNSAETNKTATVPTSKDGQPTTDSTYGSDEQLQAPYTDDPGRKIQGSTTRTFQGNEDQGNFDFNEELSNATPDSPKQAVLLLPKDYYKKNGECANNSENENDNANAGLKLSRSRTASSSSSSSSRLNFGKENTAQDEADNTMTRPLPPLSEQEVGLLHPTLETEWRRRVSQVGKPGLINETPGDMFSSQTNSGRTLNNYAEPRTTVEPTVRPQTPIKLSSLPIALKTIPNNGTNTSTSANVFPKINVLIVEDNVINQAILGSFLRKHKISYKVAKNGKEAVDIWKEGGLHLIFMDLQLPVLSGIDAAKQIRDCEKKRTASQNAPVIIVALTASNSIEDKRKALISGCNDYLTKPVNLHWLSKKITEWGCMQALIDF
ncbi:mitogen-activated protein kinase kinase kinase SSK1 KNAG_0B05140 [Huiozyma naganishii CBS 8797]|uniref:Response regulatory domain-containing protein n=1 Tax=Huiozyma naganishii (strain ATCC MYA-139 / BCRC 22969 / CBS 8797 / KCTC 17520 / NBRC 10181 / NCYC 3082 / Yp74L-3) TaxID=1071383 RepID=J7S534_HUIN7|nr:hypothetical protein KNAG_0B05140 [Kazachstania naganishii CBS 8797]CCK68946.1 hypothetical protein KNAG_0B05140 [Kazachstania naganishii CBS 8797]